MNSSSRSVPASAIQDMTGAEVRKALGKIRTMWYQSGPNCPVFICSNLVRDKTIAEFCTEFVYGHHLKRHHKSSQQQKLQMANEPGVASSSKVPASGRPGPKGDDHDPFPFTPGWTPREIPIDNKWWEYPESMSSAAAPPAEGPPEGPTKATKATQTKKQKCKP